MSDVFSGGSLLTTFICSVVIGMFDFPFLLKVVWYIF